MLLLLLRGDLERMLIEDELFAVVRDNKDDNLDLRKNLKLQATIQLSVGCNEYFQSV